MRAMHRGRPRLGRGRFVGAVLLALVGAAGCDEVDPTNVENPRTTDEDLAQAEDPVKALLPGLRAQFARAVGAVVSNTEVVSDNYSIHGTGILKELDDPGAIQPNVVNSTGTGSASSAYWHLQELRALGNFVLNEIAPNDENATSSQLAEAHYFRGIAYLMQSENFSAVPTERDGSPTDAAQVRQLAIADLQEAASGGGGGEITLRAQAALARAHRWDGNASAAASAAEAVLAGDAAFLFGPEYDPASIENNPYAFLVSRALQEMQPLPRLDFLDPKYLSRASLIPVAKAEEMHLILAEIDLAAGAEAAGADHLGDAIEAALARGAEPFVDNDPRASLDLSIRPRDAVIRIRADADSPFRSGLVLDRPDVEIQVPTVSGTSLDADSVRALRGDELWHAYHLARQEILFLEGRRMADLGIRLPIMLREIDANPNIEVGDPGTVGLVPSWIPGGEQMDLFTPFTVYDGGLLDNEQVLIGEEVTINVDMNKVLVASNRTQF